MAALTAVRLLTLRDPRIQALQVRNASVLFAGGLAACADQSNGTAASRGRLAPFTGAASEIPFGRILRNATGDTAATPIVEGELSLDGYVLQDVDVAGATVVTDSVGRIVYLLDTDNPDDDLTFVRPTRGLPFGMVIRYRTGDNCDVYAFSAAESWAIGLAGAGQATWHLGVVVTETAAAGNLITGYEAPCHGQITRVYAVCASEPVDANMNMDIQPEIDGVNLTGGVITLNFADAIGAKLVGTAVTALNTFSEGSLIDVESLAAGFVAGTAGDGVYNVYAEVRLLPGV